VWYRTGGGPADGGSAHQCATARRSDAVPVQPVQRWIADHANDRPVMAGVPQGISRSDGSDPRGRPGSVRSAASSESAYPTDLTVRMRSVPPTLLRAYRRRPT